MKRAAIFFGCALAIVACGSSHDTPSIGGGTDAGDVDANDSTSTGDDGGAASDANDAAPSLDGTPTRQVCTNKFGSGLLAQHGRLDGYLVSIVPLTTHSCNGDSTHVHLQVMMKGGVYDVAVNIDGQEFQLDHALPGTPWSEGFHTTSTLDYPTDLGVHSTSFKTTDATSLVNDLENVNHISVFGTGYGPDGMHLIHRNGTKEDGAIVVQPLSPVPHLYVFDFVGDTF